MELAVILFKQLMIMAIYMAIGYCLFKTKLVTSQGSKELGNLLLYVITPATIINAYSVERTPEKTTALLISFVAALAALLLSMLVSTLLFRKKPIEIFGVSYSNCGFMGLPLVSAVFGNEAVFYLSSAVALLNIGQWTYGVRVMSHSWDSIRVKQLAKNPILISMIVGIILFFTQLPMPMVVSKSISSVAALLSPIAMIILGTYLAQTDLLSIFTDISFYWVSVVRLLIIPALTALLFLVFPMDNTIRLSILIAASAPVGSNVAIFAQRHNLDYTRAVKEVCLTTLLSLVTMPLFIAAVTALL